MKIHEVILVRFPMSGSVLHLTTWGEREDPKGRGGWQEEGSQSAKVPKGHCDELSWEVWLVGFAMFC